jgi:serine/threonine protein kinase
VDTSSLDADSLLRKIAHAPCPDAAPLARDACDLPRVGSTIDGHYRLKAKLGKGGMGIVFAAQNLKTGREVALKLMASRDGSAPQECTQRVERFVREARAAGCIRHPNVVDVYDVGGEDALPYLVMERLHGRTLAASLSGGPLPERRAVELVLAAARGVAAAHQKGVVHRDLKPENIFLADDGDGPPIPKVLDFGISRIMAASESLDSLTRTGTILGTPAYMPYEQLRGRGSVDARADVYALGVILYEALSGKRPYEACNLHDLLLRIAHEPPTPLAQVQPAARRHVRAVVARCLQREPDRRYADAGELVAALERVLEAPDGSERAGPSRWPRTQRVLAAVVASFGCVVAVSALGFHHGKLESLQTSSSPSSSVLGEARSLEPESIRVIQAGSEAASSSPPPPSPVKPKRVRAARPTSAITEVSADEAKFERAQQLRPSDF